ncbi:pyridine nucleotide-disulfide oxidoreductase [Moraxella catarrhalis]|uniref:FAD-dependent oxidoreductase n=1 Tax=Moraxella catarrhalis TaxID=480 RepID=UPI000EAA0BD7|nr:FAD-dependent oxidoreductase [Moraxella catarrhalis]MPW73213.1 pyridine nucleotide-disulfide oxidoreductase [Moraxella catarrhalis]MPX05170.1 pyridine nucleotide-disulfide oxidoreductase [Moraxella catarrhalis]RKL76851.1 pyridine nucleotide-disulfide oxidoreductase [Moraxella catarrhalis]RKM11403.1 pyridine nucleotide-disulfide oxidoreductase [Moraxella catarrhalis]RKM13383.1 pyridine nucleotide-disulfide oxidoreductase [Moraxella catarrhalis]
MTHSHNIRHTEHLIIGFGKAGKTLAQTLAKAGKEVILVEKSADMYGGTCINIGCIPSKKLAFLSHERDASLSDAIAHKNQLIAKLNQANFDKVNELDNATVITGEASFIDDKTVQVVTADDTLKITADHIHINTGAYNWQPPIDGLKDSKFAHDSTSIMQLTQLPKQLVIIGGGYIGLEFAFIFAGFGSVVTILETADTFLPKEDADIRQNLLGIMANKQITVKTKQQIKQVNDANNHAMVVTEDGELMADAILVATGRRANTQGLDLDKAGVILTDKGNIAVNDRLQTSVPHIYAMGDVAGSPQFTYISLDDYRVVKSQVLGDGTYTTKGRTFAYAVFTNPPLANVGMTEQVAKEQGHAVKTAVLEAVNIPKAKILEQTDGLLKAVIDAKTDKILGVQLLCDNAHELINFMDLAIRQGLTYQEVRDYIFTHPTMSEALNELFAQFG